jgi:hypothetical protein
MTFVHQQGSKLIYMPDTSSPGCAMLDYDADGFQDVFMLQGTGVERTHDPERMPASHLYRVSPGAGDASPLLEEIGEVSAAGSRGWGQACLALDFDNDGYEDLLLSHYHEPLKLMRNNGDGTFREIARSRNISGDDLVWASCLTALDFNADGWLDVYVGQYLGFEDQHWIEDPPLEDDGEMMVEKTLIPGRYRTLPKRLFWNQGGTSFADVAGPMGVADARTRTYGALAADFDGDGWTDLFVANDATPCSLFRNEAGRGFSDQGNSAWVAENRGSMGLALGDVNLDGALDIIVTHWKNPAAVYRNFVRRQGQKKLRFLDRGEQYGLNVPPPLIGWATAFLDVDNDSYEDLIQLNGHTNPDPARPGKLLQQPAYLWRMLPAGHFEPVKLGPGDPLARPRVARAAAFGDLDLDGHCDVVVGNNNEPGELWMARAGTAAWVGVQLVGAGSNRNGYGGHVTLTQKKRVRHKQLASGQSFYSSNAQPMLFGLGEDDAPVTCLVRWPSGRIEEFEGLTARRYHRAVEGEGRRVSTAPAGEAPLPATSNRG